jgi:hypothetical protein
MAKSRQIGILIDRLTRSVENALTGDSFKTEVLEFTKKDIKAIKQRGWLFDWAKESMDKSKKIYKLVLTENPVNIQGLISLEEKPDHIYMHLIESAIFNRGPRKAYLGVPGNLVTYACRLSFDKGFGGYVSFESKTRLIDHYKKTLGAELLFNNVMAIDSRAAYRLVNQYYPENP